MIKLIRTVNNYSLYLLVFSITFEMWDPFKLVGSLSVTYMASTIYFISWIPLLRSNINFNTIKDYLFPLLLFIITGIASTALHSGYVEELKYAINYRVLLLIILMIFIANHLCHEKAIISKVLNIYVFSMLVVFLLSSMGQGASYINGRLLLFGENPNLLGMKSVIAFLIVAGKVMEGEITLKKLLVGVLVSFPLVSLVVLSASRAAFLSIFLGFIALLFLKKTGVTKKLVLGTISVVISIFLISYVMQNNEILQKRLANSIETGDTGRGEIWVGAGKVIENNLWLGVGFPGVLPEMYKYSGRYIDPHNVYLYVWISTGTIGLLFFLLFIGRMIKNLLLSYRQTGQTVYILIFTIVIFNMFKAGGGISKVLFWFFFAILIGSTFIESKSINIDGSKNMIDK